MACHFRVLTWLLCAYGLFVGGASVFASDTANDASNAPTDQAPNSNGAAKTEVRTAPADETGPTKPKQRAADVQQVEGMVVVGSRLPAAANQTSQDVHIYDSQRIEESGQSSVSEFLATLPEVSLATPENATLATTVRLRGAIFGSPLVLINGRRTQPTTGGTPTFGFFDLNTIPLSLVERIEVLPTGSSAIYGGDALAGVVNIVLRSDVTGIEADAGYKWANNTHQTIASLGGGWKSDKLSFSIMGSYSEQSALFGKDREITANPDYRPVGGPNLGTQFFGVPANVSSVSGNLPGLNSSFAAVPVGSSGIGLTPSDFLATQGTRNTGSYTHYEPLVPDLRRVGGFASASYRFSEKLELFGEMLATKYDLGSAPPPPFLQLASVPASNPFNPFGTTVRVSGVVQGAEDLAKITFEENFVRPLVGARGTVGTWDWEATALYSHDSGSNATYGQPNATALATALASSNPSTALNPFVDGPMASRDVLTSIYSNTVVTNFSADSTILDTFGRGTLMQLPAGALTALVGGEYEKDRLQSGFEANRTARALFTELRVPVFSVASERGAQRELLSMQGAARYDDYSDFGSKTTWQAGFELRPDERVLLRGTRATAFKPPTLYNLATPIQSFPSTVNDPLRNGETVVVQSIFGGNPGLQPTTSRSSTIGVVWSPRELRDLNVSLTGWWLRIDEPINFPISSQFVVDNESAYPGRVTRAPAPPGTVGQIVSVDRTYTNFGNTNQSGIDGSVDWRVKTEVGVFTPAVAATYMTKFEGAIAAGSPSIDRLSRAQNDGVFAPRWKGIASIGWVPAEGWNVWLDGRYIGRYTDYTPPRTIGNIWYVDASVQIGLERAFGVAKGSLGGAELLISGTNLADKLPVYSTFFRGYDVFNYDIVGRTIFVQLKLHTPG